MILVKLSCKRRGQGSAGVVVPAGGVRHPLGSGGLLLAARKFSEMVRLEAGTKISRDAGS